MTEKDNRTALPSGTKIQDYKLRKELDRGGFGITYLGLDTRGLDTELQIQVAVKEYFPKGLAVRKREPSLSVVEKSSEDKKDFDSGLERFEREAEALAKLTRESPHRNVVQFQRVFQEHRTTYIVMEYVEGLTLKELLEHQGLLTEQELRKILFPLLDGLSTVHARGIMHRDIKPGNIILRAQDGSPVLVDFGLVREMVVDAGNPYTEPFGSKGYSPLEQCLGDRKRQRVWTDIYALGAVCYESLVGKVPDGATARDYAIKRGDQDPLEPAAQAAHGRAEAGFLEAIDWALRVEPEDRPPSLEEWREKLGVRVPGKERRRVEARDNEARDNEARVNEARVKRAVETLDKEMVEIPGGTFRMGDLSGRGEDGDRPDRPVHSVEVPSFWMGKYEVTFSQWDACVADGGCSYRPHDQGWGRGNRPVITVSWDDVQKFIAWLNGKTGGVYRLPTESEWEYAARAGSESLYSWGDEIGLNQAYCRVRDSHWGGLKATVPVGNFPVNAWGLHDMHGNVWEWVEDYWRNNYEGAPKDGSAWSRGNPDIRVIRGGSWNDHPWSLRSSYRKWTERWSRFNFLGFRLARDR